MAVLEAVRGWDSLNPDVPKEKAEGTAETQPADLSPVEETKWDQAAIDKLLKEDLVSLLLQHDAHLDEGESSTEGRRIEHLKGHTC